MGWTDLLQQAAGALGVDGGQSFEQAAREAAPGALGQGLADAFRSGQTAPFSEMVGQLFGQSNGTQQAGMLNELLALVGPAVLSQAAGGALGSVMAPGATQVSAEQAGQLTPEQVQAIAAHAEQAHPGVVERLGHFYAEHPTLVKTLGSAALAIALARLKERQQG